MKNVTITLPKKYMPGIMDNFGRFIMRVGAFIMGFTLTINRELN